MSPIAAGERPHREPADQTDGEDRPMGTCEVCVRPTLEVIVVEAPTPLERRMDEHTGLALLKTG